MKEERVRYSWPETGTLDITVHAPNSATLRFVPAELEKQKEKVERLRKTQEHMRMFLEKMKDLEAKGYYSGGWDSQTNKTAISKDGKIVGYMDKDLNIEWR